MNGYKILRKDMRAPFQLEFIYELDKWYEVEQDEIRICRWGFHFFDKIRSVFGYIYQYLLSDGEYDIYEVEADGNTLYENKEDKYCSSRIRLVKKLEKKEIIKIIDKEGLVNPLLYSENDYGVRLAIAMYGYCLDKLVNDKDSAIREAVANQGYGLDILIKDTNYNVREAVANQGYGLDILVRDQHWRVRVAVARQGYGLDILVDDWHPAVRMVVAQQGHGLDKLINDEDTDVRISVVEQGYGLDKLINDPDWHVRATIAIQGYGLDILVNDPDELVRTYAKTQRDTSNKTITIDRERI